MRAFKPISLEKSKQSTPLVRFLAIVIFILLLFPQAYAFRANFAFWVGKTTSSCESLPSWLSTGPNWITSGTHKYDNSTWTTYSNGLPSNVSMGQVAVIGDYVYLYGGFSGSANGETNAIHRAPVSNPTSMTKLSPTLPAKIWRSHLAVIGDYIYLFGGRTATANSSTTNAIYRAPVSDPTSWTTTGGTLPSKVESGHLAIIGDHVYILGGSNGNSPVNVIYRAPLSNPLSWTNTGATLPTTLLASSIAVIGDYAYLFGGAISPGNHSNAIYRAPVSNPTSWTNIGATLPIPLSSAKLAIIGDYIYLFGGTTTGATKLNSIYRAPVSDPTSWTNTGATLSENIDSSHIAIVDDFVYLFGGYQLRGIYRAPLVKDCGP